MTLQEIKAAVLSCWETLRYMDEDEIREAF